MKDENNDAKSEATKMLGGQVPESVFWKFKEIASKRKESMQEAILNAAMLYIEIEAEEEAEKNVG